MTESDCYICGLARTATPDSVVFQDELWTACTVADVPGWVMLLTNRHAAGPWDLSDEEAASLGSVWVTLSGAIKDTCSAERVYFLYLGENALHFHAMLVPRREDTPPEFRGLGVVAKTAELADRPRALELAAQIRDRMTSAGR